MSHDPKDERLYHLIGIDPSILEAKDYELNLCYREIEKLKARIEELEKAKEEAMRLLSDADNLSPMDAYYAAKEWISKWGEK